MAWKNLLRWQVPSCQRDVDKRTADLPTGVLKLVTLSCDPRSTQFVMACYKCYNLVPSRAPLQPTFSRESFYSRKNSLETCGNNTHVWCGGQTMLFASLSKRTVDNVQTSIRFSAAIACNEPQWQWLTQSLFVVSAASDMNVTVWVDFGSFAVSIFVLFFYCSPLLGFGVASSVSLSWPRISVGRSFPCQLDWIRIFSRWFCSWLWVSQVWRSPSRSSPTYSVFFYWGLPLFWCSWLWLSQVRRIPSG